MTDKVREMEENTRKVKNRSVGIKVVVCFKDVSGNMKSGIIFK